MNALGSLLRFALGGVVIGGTVKSARVLARRYPKQAKFIAEQTADARKLAAFGIGAYIARRPVKSTSMAMNAVHALGVGAEKIARKPFRSMRQRKSTGPAKPAQVPGASPDRSAISRRAWVKIRAKPKKAKRD